MGLWTHCFLKTERTWRNNILVKKLLQSTVDQERLLFCHLQMTGDKIPVILFPWVDNTTCNKSHITSLHCSCNATCWQTHIPLLATYIPQVTPNTLYSLHEIWGFENLLWWQWILTSVWHLAVWHIVNNTAEYHTACIFKMKKGKLEGSQWHHISP